MPQDLNIISVSYLFSRLSPFIIICYFILQSVFNQNLKGIFYVAGVLLACVLNVSWIGAVIGSPEGIAERPICNLIDGMPTLPIGQTILGFTFAYLTYIIVKYKLTDQNMPTLIIFPILIAADFIWNIKHECSKSIALVASLSAGIVWGVIWGLIIDIVDPELQFFNGIGNKNVCKRPSSTLYRCKLAK